jgi:hypothetical protein
MTLYIENETKKFIQLKIQSGREAKTKYLFFGALKSTPRFSNVLNNLSVTF